MITTCEVSLVNVFLFFTIPQKVENFVLNFRHPERIAFNPIEGVFPAANNSNKSHLILPTI
ncbi:hypothetical protein I7I53_02784 [Histoplasma capsulatum var. duboisii H88]|uniref:Uncharacterized protein n=1 Tax=Ajellomyces capsulatus (strain H88) TaxID=544711 RepID=A0A8A1LM60_AJEC8|nr:hypothetical protein I7I53_02784 [Histoplasma capsulatum var. duboisii H88]